MKFDIDNRNNLSITKALLLKALFEMAEKKKLADISVKDLTNKAQISRATFYNNYSTIDDILLEYFNSFIISDFDAQISDYYDDATAYGLFLFKFIYSKRDFFLFLKENDKLYMVLNVFINQGEMPRLKQALYEKSNHTSEFIENFEYINIFYAGGLFMMINLWIENGMRESPERMAYIYSGLGPILNREKK